MIETAIDKLLRKLNRRGPVTPKANLYSEHVKIKLRQTRWSLDILQEIAQIPNVDGSTSSRVAWENIGTNEKILFFCECFWDFLRSSIDITAQLTNELHSLGINEENVTFYEVLKKIQPPPPTPSPMLPLLKSFESLKRSWAFRELSAYRNCSTHRRQVCIYEVSSPAPVTPGYVYMGSSTTGLMNRTLCSNPGSIHARPSKSRPVVEYNKRILKGIEKRLSTIVNRLA